MDRNYALYLRAFVSARGNDALSMLEHMKDEDGSTYAVACGVADGSQGAGLKSQHDLASKVREALGLT